MEGPDNFTIRHDLVLLLLLQNKKWSPIQIYVVDLQTTIMAMIKVNSAMVHSTAKPVWTLLAPEEINFFEISKIQKIYLNIMQDLKN